MSDLHEKLHSLATKLGMGGHSENGSTTQTEERSEVWSEGQGGETVDWSEYDIPSESLMVYRRARYTSGDWVCPYTHYQTISEPISKFSLRLEEMVNAEPQWKVLSINPNGSGMLSAVLVRISAHKLTRPEKRQVPLAELAEGDEDAVSQWVETQKG